MTKKIFLFILYFFICVTPLKAYQYQLSICAVFQNEAPYLKEWIEFHRLVGVDHFYLFNNLSTDHYKEVLRPYIRAGIVELIEWPYGYQELKEWDKIQTDALEAGRRKAYKKSQWLAFLDVDEFLFPTQCESLVDFLKSFESMPEVGGIYANWVVYGTSNVAKIPDDRLLIETLVMSSGGGSDHIKSIVKPEKVSKVYSPHYVTFKKGFFYFTPTTLRKVQGPFIGNLDLIEIHHLRINHYWSRDENHLNNVKIPRRMKWGTPAETCLLWGSMNNTHYDPAILRFAEPLKRKVFK